MTSRWCFVSLLLAVGAASLHSDRGAAQVALGPELQINVWTTNAQEAPSVSADTAGEFVVAWQSYDQTMGACYGYAGTLCNGIYGQRLDGAGRLAGGELELQDTNTVTQQAPDLAMRSTGDFVAAWDNDLYFFRPGSVLYRRFDASGQPLGPAGVANGASSGAHRRPAVATDAAGGFVVVWAYQSSDLMQRGIYGRRFDADGVPLAGEFAIQAATMAQHSDPDVARSGDGAFVVVWQDSARGVAAQRYDAAGLPAGESFPVAASGALGAPAIAVHGSGSFVVVWNSGASVDVAAQRFDADGQPVGGQLIVNEFTTGEQRSPAVAMDGAGNLLVAWESADQDGSGRGVFARRFDAAGAALGAEFQVNSQTAGDQSAPAVAATPDGDFLVVWQSPEQDGSSTGVYGRMVWVAQFADGFETGDACGWSGTVGGGCP